MTQYRIKNWGDHQHFKDRTPPWIKLHRELLDNPDWHDLDSDAAKMLISLWLIASEDKTKEGRLPDIRNIAFRLRKTEQQIKQTLTKLANWMYQDDIKPISDCLQDVIPETETETETETEHVSKKTVRKKSKTLIPDGFGISDSVKVWADENGYSNLEKRLTHFVTVAQAKGYEYADWDAAFRNAISGDWAKLGGSSKPEDSKPTEINEFYRKIGAIQ